MFLTCLMEFVCSLRAPSTASVQLGHNEGPHDQPLCVLEPFIPTSMPEAEAIRDLKPCKDNLKQCYQPGSESYPTLQADALANYDLIL